MQERDTFPFGAESWRIVDEAHAGGTAPGEGVVEVIDGETDVMNAGSAGGDELANRGVGSPGFKQLDEGFAGTEAGDPGAVGVGEWHLWHAEDVTIEGQDVVEGAYGDADVGDTRGAAGNEGHGGCAGEVRRRR